MPTEYFSSYGGKEVMARVATGGKEIAPNLVPGTEEREGQILVANEDKSKWSCDTFVDITLHVPDVDYNPLGLPPFTIRLQMIDNSNNPLNEDWKGTATRVEGTDDTWDCTYQNEDWTNLLQYQPNVKAVLGANTSGVVWMDGLFSGWKSWNLSESNLESVALFDTRDVRGMSYMFYDCKKLTTVPEFDTCNVVDMEGIFDCCEILENIPHLDTSNVRTLGNAFDFTAIRTIPHLNTSRVTNMERMFAGCTNLETIPLIDTANVTNMSGMFDGCISLISIPLLDTSKVTNMDDMFNECETLNSIPLFDTSRAESMNGTFTYCVNVGSGALALYNQASSQASPPSDTTACFSDCGSNTETGRAELAQIPASWGGTGS